MLSLLKRFWTWFDHQFGGCFWKYPPRNRGDAPTRQCSYCGSVQHKHVLEYPRGHSTEWRRDRPYNYYRITDAVHKKEQADRGC